MGGDIARRARDQKGDELARSRTLNSHPENVSDEAFGSSEFFDARDVVQVKYEMVRKVETDGTTVSAAAGAFGMSRQSYYGAAAALAEGGLAGLLPAKPGPRGAHKLTDEVVDHLENTHSPISGGLFGELHWSIRGTREQSRLAGGRIWFHERRTTGSRVGNSG